MTTMDRWRTAQRYVRGYWQGVAEGVAAGRNDSESELRRVLRSAGVLYLTVNVRTRWGYLMHRALSRLRIDPGHPHTMTPRRIRWMVEESGFRIADLDTDPLWPAWKADLFAGALRPLVKGLLGVSESVTSLLATKVGAAGPRSGFG